MSRSYKAKSKRCTRGASLAPGYGSSRVESQGGSLQVLERCFPAPEHDANHTWGAGRGAFKKQTSLEFTPLLLEIRHIHFVL